MPQYVTLIVPLALRGAFTYSLPPVLEGRVEKGARVVVQFGPKRYYTGIVVQVHHEHPQPGLELKEVTDLADPAPIVLPQQIELWRWICNYYMCTPGEVMKAALPSGLKPESETLIVRNPEFEPTQPLTPREQAVMQALKTDKGYKLQTLEKDLGIPHLLNPIRHLLETGAVKVYENLQQRFKPRTENYVQLAPSWANSQLLASLAESLKRLKAQEALLLRFLDLSGAAAELDNGATPRTYEVLRTTLCTTDSEKTALTALRKKGVLEVCARVCGRLPQTMDMPDGKPRYNRQPRKQLAEQQQCAYNRIVQLFDEKDICLLHGVTSSGKTEVYMALIEKVLAQGKQVLYLVPEIALTTQLTTRLQRVFGEEMGVYHSKFPDAERVELWKQQLGNHPFKLILGVRSAVFLPFKNLGLVIVDEEHETSYKQQDPAPRYHARDTAIILARSYGAKVLLGTATPSVESYRHALSGKYGLVEMMHRYGAVEMPEIVVEDVKELRRKKLMKTPFSPRLTDEVRQALERGEQAIFFQNRRGYSPVLECRTCGWTPRCTQCDVSLTYHQRMNRLVCHYCGSVYDLPKQCPNCACTELRDQGYGTEKIESAAQTAFPEARTARMDLDTTRTRNAYEQLITRFQKRETDLLIGTQMVTKGLDFDHVHVVGIINADHMLNVPDFRAHERAFQMLLQVAGRAGRRGQRGLVVLQTRQPDLPLIQQVVRGDYRAMFHDQLEERTLFNFPPACRLIDIYLKHRKEEVVAHAADILAGMLRPHFGKGLLGPDRPAVSRIQLLYIRKLVLKIPGNLPTSGVRRTLWAAYDLLQQQTGCKGVALYFDVDP